jgi:hypothetical protein
MMAALETALGGPYLARHVPAIQKTGEPLLAKLLEFCQRSI